MNLSSNSCKTTSALLTTSGLTGETTITETKKSRSIRYEYASGPEASFSNRAALEKGVPTVYWCLSSMNMSLKEVEDAIEKSGISNVFVRICGDQDCKLHRIAKRETKLDGPVVETESEKNQPVQREEPSSEKLFRLLWFASKLTPIQ